MDYDQTHPMTKTGGNTKEIILQVALNLFSENGYKKTSIRQIVKLVGIRESSLYNHFSCKKEIIETLLHNFGVGYFTKVLENSAFKGKIDNPYEFLKLLSQPFITQFSDPEKNKILRIIVMEFFLLDDLKDTLVSELTTLRIITADIFQQMIDNGQIKPNDTLYLAYEFITPLLMHGLEYLLRNYDNADVSSIIEFFDNHVDFFWNMFKK